MKNGYKSDPPPWGDGPLPPNVERLSRQIMRHALRIRRENPELWARIQARAAVIKAEEQAAANIG